jgi:carboxypeptidase C (cathepsin A)
MMLFPLRISVLALLLASPLAVVAQPAPQPSTDAQKALRPERGPEAREGRRLPPDVTSEHELQLPGRTLKFTATAGSLPLVDPAGNVQAEIGYVAYRLAGAEPGSRPVTFALNGGPGAASAYLHLGPIGPWRLPVGAASVSPSQPPTLVPNAETWLDFTDLVFIDPIDTGYSRANGSPDEIRDRYFTIDGDVASLSAVIARWLRANDRLGSPKFYIGESYGGFRGPLIAHKLQTEIGIGLSGLVLLSPVLDFGLLSQPRHAPMDFVTRLPSYAAARLELKGTVSRDALADVERYAAGEYLTDLTRGLQDREAVSRVSTRVAELTGLDPELVRRRAGRVDAGTFTREFRRQDSRVVSLYDTGVSSPDPDPTASTREGDDPGLTALTAPLTSAIVHHLWENLGWRVPNQRYELLNGSVNGRWRFGRGRSSPQVVDDLKQAIALDPKLRVMVVHGLTDLVTPYFANELILRQLPPDTGARVSLATYPGGHMFYNRDGSRAAFRADAERMYGEALRARAGDEAGASAPRPELDRPAADR